MKSSLYRLAIILFIVALSACSKGRYETQDKSVTLATVNGRVLTANQFRDKTERIQKHLNINLEVFEEKEKLLEDMITTELIYQKAISENFHSEPEMREIIATKYLKSKVKEPKVSLSEAKKFFEENKNKMESVRASHILIMPKKPVTEQTEEAARKKASELLVRLLNGEDFAKLAKEHSDDPGNASKGGDLGFFRRGKMVKEFEQAAFNLEEIGDISKVVKTQFGYHIIKLTGSKRGFETFKDSITERLKLEKQRNSYEDIIKKLRKEAQIETNKGNLSNLKIINERTLMK